MKLTLIIICILLFVTLLLYLRRILRATTAEAQVTAELNAPVEQVWQKLNALENYPSWHPSIKRVDKLEENRFVVVPEVGRARVFTRLTTDPLHRLEFSIKGEQIALLRFELQASASGTQLKVLERIALKAPWFGTRAVQPTDLEHGPRGWLSAFELSIKSQPEEISQP